MFWLKKILRKNKKNIILFVVFFIILLFFCFLLGTTIRKDDLSIPSLTEQRPAKEIKINNRDFIGQVYFNDQFYTEIFSDLIIPEIKKARSSIEVAMYSFNSEKLRDEIYLANKRGVKVTLILNKRKKKQHDIVFANLPQNIKRFDLGESTEEQIGLMHHKFVIIDRGKKNQKLITGSLNWTKLQEKFDPGCLLITPDQEIIESYGEEFERLKSGIGESQKLKIKNYRPWAKRINYRDCFVDLWWSPGIKSNSIKQEIIDLVNKAEKNIKIIIWQATDYNIAKAIIEKATKGIEVKIITEDFNIWYEDSMFPYIFREIQKAGLKNIEIVDDTWRTLDLKDEVPDPPNRAAFNSFIHRHTLIIDDQIVLFGTNNWSKGGTYRNDENIIITNNKNIVSSFIKSFAYHYNKLRKNTLSMKIQNNSLFVDLDDDYLGKKLIMVISENYDLNENPFICTKDKIIKNNHTFVIPLDCRNHNLNVFIYDANGDLVAGNLIIVNK